MLNKHHDLGNLAVAQADELTNTKAITALIDIRPPAGKSPVRHPAAGAARGADAEAIRPIPCHAAIL
jgi:hypothetical protein